MKKIVCLVSALLLTASLVACGEKENNDLPIINEPIQNQEIENTEENYVEPELNEEENNTTFYPIEDLNVFETTKTITLPENPTTGYTWGYEIADDSIVNIDKDSYVMNEAEEGMVGVGGVHKYALKGVKEGETSITFRYKRSWEEEAINEVTFNVSVDSELNIAITSEE